MFLLGMPYQPETFTLKSVQHQRNDVIISSNVTKFQETVLKFFSSIWTEKRREYVVIHVVDDIINKSWLWLIFVYPEIVETKINYKINIQWNTNFMTTYAICEKSYHCMHLFWTIPFDMYSTNTFTFIKMYNITYVIM